MAEEAPQIRCQSLMAELFGLVKYEVLFALSFPLSSPTLSSADRNTHRSRILRHLCGASLAGPYRDLRIWFECCPRACQSMKGEVETGRQPE